MKKVFIPPVIISKCFNFADKINIPFHIAEDPLLSVAKGTGIALKNVDRFSFLMR